MVDYLPNPIRGFKKPQYTGENRCTPCTIVNIAISVILSSLLYAFVSPAAGVGMAGISLVLIYFWGYLVPGTPTFTKRYLPDWVLARFDKLEPKQVEISSESLEPELVLKKANVVQSCEDIEDLCLTESFRKEWQSHINAIDAEDSKKDYLSKILNVNADELTIEDYEDAIVAKSGGQRLGQWESLPALLADFGGAKTLKDQYPDWGTLSVINQSRVLSALRIFLDACPGCGGKVMMDSETVESCCRTMDVVVVNCTSCNARLLEVEQE